MPSPSTSELVVEMVGSAVTRAFCVGLTVWLAMALWPVVHVTPVHPAAILCLGPGYGAIFLALIGILTSTWA